MKPRETKDESMQRADTQYPLRSSSPASSEAQPDHCRKRCPKGGTSPVHAVSAPRGTWEKGAAHGGKKNREEERVVPSESNPDALRKKRERGAKEGNQTLFNHQVDLSISKVRRSSV